jgi:hypothetical protein
MQEIKEESKFTQILQVKLLIIEDLKKSPCKVIDLCEKYGIDKRTVHRLIRHLNLTGWKVTKKNATYFIREVDNGFIEMLQNTINILKDGEADN